MEQIMKNLMLFNGTIASSREWEIILRGCGCPKNQYFRKALREHALFMLKRNYYILDGIDADTFQKIWDDYCTNNRAGVKKAYDKKRRIERIAEYKKNEKPRKFTLINGCVVLGDEYDFD